MSDVAVGQEEIERQRRLLEIFLPFATGRRKDLEKENGRLAYYTTAETALKIFKNAEFWLRDSRCMNDYMEISTGLTAIDNHFLNDAQRQAFIDVVDACHPGASTNILTRWHENKLALVPNTYLMSLSAHATKTAPLGVRENDYGRLSMWRAYGHNRGVAIVFRVPPVNEQQVSNIILSPVAYLEDIKAEMERVLKNIDEHKSMLKGLTQEEYENHILGLLTLAAVCIKNIGFTEEQEWRLLFLANIFGHDPLVVETETVNGVPQLVCKLKLKKLTDLGFDNANFDSLIDRVIIGPTINPNSIFDALTFEMGKAGIKDPAKRIHISRIPLRT